MILSEGEIPNGEILFRYAKPSSFPIGQEEIPNAIFEDRSLSCDWAKHQTSPENSYHIQEGKSLIIEIIVSELIKDPTNPKRVGQIVPAWKQEIIHSPITAEEDPAHGENDSHALINGVKNKPVTDAIKTQSKYRNIEVLKNYWKGA